MMNIKTISQRARLEQKIIDYQRLIEDQNKKIYKEKDPVQREKHKKRLMYYIDSLKSYRMLIEAGREY